MNSADQNGPDRRLLEQLELATARETSSPQHLDEETQKLRETWVEFGAEVRKSLAEHELHQLELATSKTLLPGQQLDPETQMLRAGWAAFSKLMSGIEGTELKDSPSDHLAETQVAPVSSAAVPPPVPVQRPMPAQPPVQADLEAPPVQLPSLNSPRVRVKRSTTEAPIWGWVAMAAAFLMAAGLGWYVLNSGTTRVADIPNETEPNQPDNSPEDRIPAEVIVNDIPNSSVPNSVPNSVPDGLVPSDGGPTVNNEPAIVQTPVENADPYAWDSSLDEDITTARERMLVFENRWQRWDISSLAVDYELNSFSERIDDGSL
jgi:hypothetical protein